MKITDTIKQPRFTEKAYSIMPSDKYIFDVDADADKKSIKEAIEALFNVKVISVKTLKIRGKNKVRGVKRKNTVRVGRGKKAIVQLEKGKSISIFDEFFKVDKK